MIEKKVHALSPSGRLVVKMSLNSSILKFSLLGGTVLYFLNILHMSSKKAKSSCFMEVVEERKSNRNRTAWRFAFAENFLIKLPVTRKKKQLGCFTVVVLVSGKRKFFSPPSPPPQLTVNTYDKLGAESRLVRWDLS